MSRDPSGFFAAHSDAFRGPFREIVERLRVYEDLIPKADRGTIVAIDLGCGRGEWLSLCVDWGLRVSGADLDPLLVKRCQEAGLPAAEVDGLEYLANTASDSVDVLTAFHLIEHLDPPDLIRLLLEAHRVLSGRGVVILETPNPESLLVAGNNFYLDPSHKAPIPPLLLAMMASWAGFAHVQIIRLRGLDRQQLKSVNSLSTVLNRSSMDYALIAWKDPDDDGLTSQRRVACQRLDEATTADVLGSYDHWLSAELRNLNGRIERLESATDLAKRSWIPRLRRGDSEDS